MPHSRLLIAANRLRMVADGLSDPGDVLVVQGYLSDLEKLARCEMAIVDVPGHARHDLRLERAAVLSAFFKKAFGVTYKMPFLDLLSDLDDFDLAGSNDSLHPGFAPRRLS